MAKALLVRFVYTFDDGIQLDKKQRMPGRGAYLCRDISCLEKAWKRRAFVRALRISSSQHQVMNLEMLHRLEREMEILIPGDEGRPKEGDVNEQT